MTRLRLALHALDRTGPPMLALAYARWLLANRPEVSVEVVAFRGGELADEPTWRDRVVVLLDDSEPWDHASPVPERVDVVRERASALGPSDVTLLVSVAAGQVLPYVADGGRVVAWSVEVGEDLHWLDSPLQLRSRVDGWLAGSLATADELHSRFGIDPGPPVAEFVAVPPRPPAPTIAALRASVDATPDAVVVLGAGIATHRKAPDLFVETALACRASLPSTTRYVWVGGQDDPLHAPVGEDARVAAPGEVFVLGSVSDLDAWCVAADVFVHPARRDAFPLVCLHAALAATPVVGFSGVGGLVEMFGDAFVGAEYPDVAALAAQAVRIAGAEEGRRVGAAQRSHVLDRFVADVAAPALHDRLIGQWAHS